MAMTKEDRKYGEIIIRFANSNSLEKAIKAGKSFPKIVETIVAGDSYEDKKKKVIKLLDELIAIDNLNDSKLISDYIRSYNEHCTSKMQINKRGKIVNNYFFRNLESIKYDDLLVFSIIRFLMNFKLNKPFIRRCEFKGCNRYFLSKQQGPRVKHCPRCRNKNTYTREEYKKYHLNRQINKYRKKVIDLIIDYITRDLNDLESIKIPFNDDQKPREWLQKSGWTIERAYEAAMNTLKKQNTAKNASTE